jgi:two-component system sensor histidine kinase BarA
MRAEGTRSAAEAIPTSGPALERPRLGDLLPEREARELFESFTAASGLGVSLVDANREVVVGPLQSDDLLALRPEVGDLLRHRTENASFIVVPVAYDLETIGQLNVGPLNPVEGANAEKLVEHLMVSLDLLLHARQRAHFASSMHLASIEESYNELLRKNAALEEAFARLKELDHLKSSFLATVSHELRTPLTSIIGYSEMLAEGMSGPLTTEQLEFVQTIRQKGDQLLRLILSLLDLSKLESGTMRMHPISVPIEALLSDAVTTVGPTAAKRGVRLSLKPGPPVPYLRADPDRLRQVFVNLVDNAVKFTPKGGEVSLSVGLAQSRPQDLAGAVLLTPVRREVEIRVADTGIGIPHHERQRIFDAFYQVDQSSTREQGGAGLGLAIVKRLVEAHQGRIRVEDTEPRGATFVVTLPVSASSTSGARARVELPPSER